MSESWYDSRCLSRRRFTQMAAATGLTLAGCQLPGSGPAARRLSLSPADDFAPTMPSVGWALRVKEPNATLSLNTAKIAYVAQAGQVEYLAGAEWSSRAPEMVMELITRSFENTNKILSVGDRRSRVRPDFELETELRDFHFEESGKGKGVAKVGLVARLVQHPRRNVVASFPFDAATEVDDASLDGIVAGFESSLQEVMAQLVEWTLRTGVGA